MPDKLICGLVRFVSLLPSPARRLLALLSAVTARTTGSRSARITETNLSIAFPNISRQERHKLALNSLTETALTLMEAPVVWKWGPQKIRSSTTEFLGSCRPEDLCKNRHGAILVTPHIGSWEFLGLLIATYVNLMIVYKPHRVLCLREMTERGRRSTGAKLATADRPGIKLIVNHIRTNGHIGLLPDQVPDRSQGVFASFFGRPALTTTLAHSLAKRHDLPVYICCAIRNEKGYSVYIEQMDRDFAALDTLNAANILNTRVENLIKRWPQHYNWMYKRYRYSPKGMRSPYS